MPTKIFTVLGGLCPFGKGCEIDSSSCRQCDQYYRAGTGTFFWCRGNETTTSQKPKAETRTKSGRPAKNAQKRPVKADKKKKR